MHYLIIGIIQLMWCERSKRRQAYCWEHFEAKDTHKLSNYCSISCKLLAYLKWLLKNCLIAR